MGSNETKKGGQKKKKNKDKLESKACHLNPATDEAESSATVSIHLPAEFLEIKFGTATASFFRLSLDLVQEGPPRESLRRWGAERRLSRPYSRGCM